MLRIIPAIDLRGGRCVRLQQGDYDRQTTYDIDPVTMAGEFADQGASVIHVVDLDGARDGTGANRETVGRICQAVPTAIELGGGIRAAADVRRALDLGVRRVVLGTSLAEDPALAVDLTRAFPVERLVAGLDARDGQIAVRGWRQSAGVATEDLARELFAHGLRRFIFTDIRTDGMFTGPNLEAVAALCRLLPEARVIASGGVSTPADVAALAGLGLPNLEGVIVGKALYDGRVTYAELVAAAG